MRTTDTALRMFRQHANVLPLSAPDAAGAQSFICSRHMQIDTQHADLRRKLAQESDSMQECCPSSLQQCGEGQS